MDTKIKVLKDHKVDLGGEEYLDRNQELREVARGYGVQGGGKVAQGMRAVS